MMRTADDLQKTLADVVVLDGVGVHSGKPARLVVNPAPTDTGILFQRSDLDGDVTVPATFAAVGATELCTVLGHASGASVATVEHLMAALTALGVDNAVIEVDGPEVPIMDGSAAPFVAAFEAAGLVVQGRRRRYLKVVKPVRVDHGDAFGELEPWPTRRFEVTIDFDSAIIGRQSIEFDLSAGFFRTELARARTFGRVAEVEKLWAMGFALGSSLDNSVAIADDRVLNPEGLRFENEFVRHKALDAVGDLALAGLPILGLYRSFKGGHRINVGVVKALFSDSSAYEIVESAPRREPGHADVGGGLAVAALGPDRR